MSSRTQICITIDTEFSIAGHFQAPEKYTPLSEPVVTCATEGKEHGLGFLLDTFDKYDTSASFFVETANHAYFGDEPMRGFIKRIQQAGRDVQLHVHPVWLSFLDNAEAMGFVRNDNCAHRSFDDLKNAFSYCIDIFELWAGNKPLAVRTGSLWADRNVYKVLSALGVPMASNLGLGVYRPDDEGLQHLSGRHQIEGVMELPVFTYQDGGTADSPHMKSLQITSCSWPEMKHLLWKARAQGVENIVVLTHPFEFIKKRDFQYKKLIRNRINQERLSKLCQFIQHHDQDFVSTDFTQSKDQWTATELSQPDISIPSFYSVGRKIHNKINDTFWAY